jgi:hypothetical protein
VWTFILKDVKFKLDNSQQIEVDKVRIVSTFCIDFLTTGNGGMANLCFSVERQLSTQQWKEVEYASGLFISSFWEGMMGVFFSWAMDQGVQRAQPITERIRYSKSNREMLHTCQYRCQDQVQVVQRTKYK